MMQKQFRGSCSSQEEHVLKPSFCFLCTSRSSCSSQEEHVLKLLLPFGVVCLFVLLLARGACIETERDYRYNGNAPGCSSQEEHVLKLQIEISVQQYPPLLLARGACIETRNLKNGECGLCCSSQEEHVLKHGTEREQPRDGELLLARGACIETLRGCPPASPHAVAPRKRSMY